MFPALFVTSMSDDGIELTVTDQLSRLIERQDDSR
jgi:hypothetical protein